MSIHSSRVLLSSEIEKILNKIKTTFDQPSLKIPTEYTIGMILYCVLPHNLFVGESIK